MPTPYASSEELDAVTNLGSEYTFWKVTRPFAVMELEAFSEEYGWVNATLSERAVLLYDGESKPKYYEFRVIQDGKEVGAIVTVAQKKDGGPVVKITKTMKDYGKILLQSLDFKIIANGTGYAFAPLSVPGDDIIFAVDPDSGGLTNVSVDIGFTEFITNISPELRSNLGFTNDTIIQEGIQAETQNRAENESLWISIEEDRSNILALSDEMIQGNVVIETNNPPIAANSKAYPKIGIVKKINTLPQFDTPLMKSIAGTNLWVCLNDIWKYYNFGDYWYWCGPTSLHWVEIGLFGLAYKTPLQWSNDYVLINQNTGSSGWNGISWPWLLNDALRSVTGKQYGVKGHHCHWWETAKNYIINDKLPLLSLRTGKKIGTGKKDYQWHYRVIYGVGEMGIKIGGMIFHNTQFFFIHDNRYDGGDFVEPKNQGFHFAMYPVIH